MKKILISLCIVSIFFSQSYAVSIKIVSADEQQRLETDVTRGQAFEFFASFYADIVPTSSQYISLKYKDILPTSPIYSSLQKLVYLDLIKNTDSFIYPEKIINSYTFGVLSENILWVNPNTSESDTLKTTNTKVKNLESLKETLAKNEWILKLDDGILAPSKQMQIFEDVYNTLIKGYYGRNDLDTQEMIYKAIEWVAEGVWDDYTTYFPPTDNKDFQENLNGEYQGIGSYVEMREPGFFLIITPMVGSPAEKAGLKGGDRVTHVDGKEITESVWLKEAVSWIKGPQGTVVTLTIFRNGQTFDVEVIRDLIIVKDIQSKFLDTSTYYIQIKNFGPNVASEFRKSLEELSGNAKVKKVIFDLRNDPGGYLDQASDMLSYFVPKGEATTILSYWETDTQYTSVGYELIDWTKYKLVILQNSGSASASEIVIWGIKDYFPDTILIGERTFGKGSVQTIKSYFDGSSLKYTVAKWFTGKTRTGIDQTGIEPDIILELDQTRFNNGYDNQLEAAKRQ